MRNRWILLVGPFVCLLALNPSVASALSLCDVNGSSESFSAEGSNLTFSDFAVTVTGNRGIDLNLIDIVFEQDGFRLVGPMAATGGKLLDIVLDYTVSSSDRIVAVELAFTGFASGAASASVAETIDEFPEVALGVFDNATSTLTRDSASLGDGANELHITKDILLESVSGAREHHDNGNHFGWLRGKHHGWSGDVPPGWQRHGDDGDDEGESEDCGDSNCWCHWRRFLHDGGGIAHISSIEQHFTTSANPVPEPSSLLLLGFGMGGLAVLRRRPA